jgi:tetratricopeptide (TPR) repeat protein
MQDAVTVLRAAQERLGQGQPAAAIPLFIEAANGPEPRVRFMALLGLSRACSSAGDPAGAEAAARRAVATAPDDCTGYALLALASIDLDRFDDAADAAGMALGRVSDMAVQAPPLLNLSARIAVLRGQLGDALGLVERCLEIRPFDRRALSYRPALAAALGIQEAGQSPLDFENLVRVTQVAAPEGFPGIAGFNAEIVAEILRTPALAAAGPGRTLVGGARLPTIAALRPDLARALRHMFREAVAAYDRVGAADGRDAAGAGHPGRFDIAGWASIMEAGAYEMPHIHEGGRVSGVYYPQMPPAGPAEDGAIVFGGHDLPEAALPLGPTRAYVPEAGDMVLFPSWLHHRTLPFAGPGRRVSVAFDARPAGGVAALRPVP